MPGAAACALARRAHPRGRRPGSATRWRRYPGRPRARPAPAGGLMRVLFVCLGNICRSPTAEGVLRHKLHEAGLVGQVQVDSAGTGDWHVGKAPDARTRVAAQRRGYDLSQLRARQVAAEDFARFDLILAMDESNL